MKLFRPALAGILLALVLLVGIRFCAGAASTAQPPAMQSRFTADGAVNHHLWLALSASFDGVLPSAARLDTPWQARHLSIEDRVAYQRAIEEVYWRHRIWPGNRGERPALDAVMPPGFIEKKVRDYLRDSELLDITVDGKVNHGDTTLEKSNL